MRNDVPAVLPLRLFTLGAGVELVAVAGLIGAVDHQLIDARQAIVLTAVVGLGGLGSGVWILVRRMKEARLQVKTLREAVAEARSEHSDNERRFRRLIDSLPHAAWIANPYGNVEWFNQKWREYAGGVPELLTGARAWRWDTVIHPEDADICARLWTDAITAGEPFHAEFRFRRERDGAHRWHLARALPVRDASGRISHWLGTCTDIHAGIESELARRRANEMPAVPPESRPPRILVAEDSPMGQAVAKRILENMGYLVTAVANGREALSSLRKNQYDLVLMDCQMPDMDGYEATTEIRKQSELGGAGIPIIAVTGNAAKGERERCLEAGMNDYLSKPVRKEQLEQLVRGWLEKKSP